MVTYDIYEQKEQTQDIIGNRTVTRYHTENKMKAFKFMNEKNKIAGKNIWRVAVQISDRVMFDIDTKSIDNVRKINYFYTDLLKTTFRTIQTLHGYHLISQYPYTDSIVLQYDQCKILNPLLEPQNLQKYIEIVELFYREERDKKKINGLLRDDFVPYFAKVFKESGLFFGVGDFDILFAVNVIMKGYYCLRISKKSIDDKPEMILL